MNNSLFVRYGLQLNLCAFVFCFFVALRPNADHDLLIFEVSGSHTTHQIRYDCYGQVISSSHRPLSDNTQTYMPPAGFESTISAGERSQIYALDRAY